MGDSMVEQVLKKQYTLVVEIEVLLLGEDLLTAVTLIIDILLFELVVDGGWPGKHVDHGDIWHGDEGKIVQDCLCVRVHEEYLFFHLREEDVRLIITLHHLSKLCLKDQIEEPKLVIVNVSNLLWNLEHDLVL